MLELVELRSAETPAPHDYQDHQDTAMVVPGGRISPSKNTRYTAKIIKLAKESPGPSKYADYLMRDMSEDIQGGRFSNAQPKTEIEGAVAISRNTRTKPL